MHHINLIKENAEVFAWLLRDILGIDIDVI